MEVIMSQQAHGTQTLSQKTDYESSKTDHETVNLYHGNKYSPNGPFNRHINNFPSRGNVLHGSPQQPPYKTIPITFDGTNGEDGTRFSYYVPNKRGIMHFSKAPRLGDIFRSQRFDNVLILDFVSTENPPQELHNLPSSGDSRDRDLYRVHEENGVRSLQKMGHEIFTFHEENTTATYYLPDKVIALHFTSVPKDGDIFCSQRKDNVLILEFLPTESSEGHHNMHSRDRELYQVHERNGGFSLMKMDDNNMPSEEYYCSGGVTQEENATFTYYLHDKDMAFHFTRLPTHSFVFHSQRRNNIMILDLFPSDNFKDGLKLRSYGSPWNTDFYRVQQRDDGFELVRITYSKTSFTVEDVICRQLKIRRYIGSNTSPAKENDVCNVCLAAYKDFDRVGSMDCGHEYHVSCIIPWLRHNRFCHICKKKLIFNKYSETEI